MQRRKYAQVLWLNNLHEMRRCTTLISVFRPTTFIPRVWDHSNNATWKGHKIPYENSQFSWQITELRKKTRRHGRHLEGGHVPLSKKQMGTVINYTRFQMQNKQISSDP
jgi:hypothetical protein